MKPKPFKPLALLYNDRSVAFGRILLWLMVAIVTLSWSQIVLAEKLYKWIDRRGQINITSSYPSKSLIRKGSRVEIIDDSNTAGKSSTVIIKTDTISDEEKRELARRSKKHRELDKERIKLADEHAYFKAKVRQLKIDVLRMEQKVEIDNERLADEENVQQQERLAGLKTEYESTVSRLRNIDLRLLRLKQEIENLK